MASMFLLRDVADSQHDERSTYCEMARNRQQAGEFAEAALMYAKCAEATEGRDESDLLFLSTALMNAAWTFNQANQDSESLHYAEEALIYIRKIGRPVVDPAPWLSG